MPTPPLPERTAVSYRQQYRRCGKRACLRCAPGQPGHGPYWYAFWTEDGRSRSRYLGKDRPAELVPSQVQPGSGSVPLPAPAGISDRVGSGLLHAGLRVPDVHPAAPLVAARPGLRVRTLGGFMVWRGGQELPAGRWARGKMGALLKLLLGAPELRLPREQVVELLWPEADWAKGAANMRSTLRYLREALDDPAGGPSFLQAAGPLLILDPAPGVSSPPDWLDWAAFALRADVALAGSDREACRAALALYGGEYLPEDRCEDWAAIPRQRLAEQHLRLLLRLARLAAAAGDTEEAIWSLRAALAADPGHEEAARALMGVLLGDGRHGEAARVYTGLVEVLREDLDVAPAPETEALRATICLPGPARDAAPTTPHNLPVSPMRLVGRHAALAALEHALGRARTGAGGPGQLLDMRLLTLLGPGGVGKTRLALAAAQAALDMYPDGVWLVELAPLVASAADDPTPVVVAAVAALGIREQPGQPLLAALIERLRDRRALLLLDNCEHVVAACGQLAVRLLAGCAGLQVLATSREALGVLGEVAWPVAPLALPLEPVGMPAAEALAALGRNEAVQLFVERGHAVRQGFALSTANAASVAQICRRLDGLPLAIELAAARLGGLAPGDIASHLDDRFRLLRRGNRAALPRHQTLQATMDWSYELLGSPERAVLRRLAAFAGGWDLRAAEAICGGEGIEAAEVPDLLGQLVAKSLVQLQTPPDEGSANGGDARYTLLETVRQYAWQLAERQGEARDVRERHLAWCVVLAREADVQLQGVDQAAWVARLEREHDNLRAALTWSSAPERGPGADPLAGLRLAGHIARFWLIHGHLGEGRRWLATLLDGSPMDPTDEKDPAAAMVWLRALAGAGMLAHFQVDFEQSSRQYERTIALARTIGARDWLASGLHNLGNSRQEAGDFVAGVALLEESLSLARAMGDRILAASVLNTLGGGAYRQGDAPRAVPLLEESVALFREIDMGRGLASALGNLANAWQRAGHAVRSAQANEESLRLYHGLGDRMGVAWCLEGIALLAHPAGRAREAARMLGGAAALRATTGVPVEPNYRAVYDAGLAMVRDALGEEGLQREWDAGAALDLDAMASLGLGEARQCAESCWHDSTPSAIALVG